MAKEYRVNIQLQFTDAATRDSVATQLDNIAKAQTPVATGGTLIAASLKKYEIETTTVSNEELTTYP